MTYCLKQWRICSSLWHTSGHQYILVILVAVMKYFLTSWNSFWHSFHSFWHYDALLTSWLTFHILWRHEVHFDTMTCFPYLVTALYSFWRHDVLIDVIIMLWLCLMTYSIPLTSWRTFGRFDIFFVNVLTSWCIFHTFVRHNVFFVDMI